MREALYVWVVMFKDEKEAVRHMGVLADRIERFILEKLTNGEEGMTVILQRNELADELECAPSQISYVLSTRFSPARGFEVESRRGLGGFIRIRKADAAGDENAGTFLPVLRRSLPQVPRSIAEADALLYSLFRQGLLSQREAAFLHEAFDVLYIQADMTDDHRGIYVLYARLMMMIGEG